MESNLNVVPLTPMVQRYAAGFCSGNDYLDNFLKSTIALNAAYGKTYVWLTEDNKRIIGYYSLGVGYLERVLKDEKSRIKLGGSIHINGFALDKKYHGVYQGVTEDGEKISFDVPIVANSREDAPEKRTFHEKFTLKSREYKYGDKYYLVLADANNEKNILQQYEFMIDIAFVDDFGF